MQFKGSRAAIYHALVEIGFIIFLFYSNLLMGELTRSNRKPLHAALYDMFTPENFAVGLVSALIGYVVFEFLRKKQ